jgi:hypothetical protein
MTSRCGTGLLRQLAPAGMRAEEALPSISALILYIMHIIILTEYKRKPFSRPAEALLAA